MSDNIDEYRAEQLRRVRGTWARTGIAPMTPEQERLAEQFMALIDTGVKLATETVDLANDIDVSNEDRQVLLRGMMSGNTDTPECKAILARARFKPGRLARWKQSVDEGK